MFSDNRQGEYSVDVAGIGRAGEAGHDVELLEKAAHHLVRIFLGRQLVELREDLRERDLNGGDGALGVILALLFETLSMLEELFAVEIDEDIESVGCGRG